MADDLTLRLSLVVDGVDNVQTAMGQASASVQAGATQIAGNIKEADVAMAEFADNTSSAATEVIPPLESIPASLQDVPPAAGQMADAVTSSTSSMAAGFKHATHAGIMGFEQVQQKVIDLTKRNAELRMAALAATDPAQQKVLNAEFRLSQQHLNAARQELMALNFEQREAVEKAQLLAGQFGVALPGGITRIMARLPLLQAATEAAFPVLIVTAFLAALREVPDAIARGTDAIMGFGEEAKKRYEEAVQANLRLLTDNLKLHESLRGLGTTSLSGLEKLSVEHRNLQENIKETGDLMAVLIRSQIAQQAEVDALRSGWRLWGTAATGWVDGTDQRIQKLLTSIKNEQGVIAQLESQLRTLREYEPHKLGAETGAEERRLAEARAEVRRRVALAELDASKALLAQQREVHLSSGSQEITDMRVLADRKIAIEREYYRERIRLAQSGVDRSRFTADLEAAELAYRATLTELNTRQISEERRLAGERIAAQQDVTRANLDAEQQWISDALSLRRISVDEATRYELETERERYTEARRTLFEQGALEHTDKETLNARLQALEIEHQNKLSAIEAEGERRRIEQGLREANLEFASVAAGSDREFAMRRRHNDERLATHQISLSQYQAEETAALNEWHERQREALERWLNLIKTAYGEGSLEYREMLERLKALDAQRANELDRVHAQIEELHRRSIQAITDEVTGSLAQWIVGYQTWRDAATQALARMTTAVIQNLLQQAAAMLVNAALQKKIAKESVLRDAAESAAHAFRSVMQALPWPANIIVAPIAAAGTFAAVMAFGKFEKGGVVDETTLALLHPQEMVLPAALSTRLEAMLASSKESTRVTYAGGGILPQTDLALIHHNDMVLPEPISVMLQQATGRGAMGTEAAGSSRMSFTYAPSVQALDRRGVDELLQRNARDISKLVRKEMRRGRLPSL